MYFTELMIINKCMIGCALDTVSTEDDEQDYDVDADSALQLLRMNKASFLSTGYWFNREYNKALSINENNNILVPADILDIKVLNTNHDITVRSGKLYDKTDHTYDMTDIAKNGLIYVDVVLNLSFSDLHVLAQNVIGFGTIVEFISTRGSDSAVIDMYQKKYAQALSDLQQEVLRHEGYNAFNTPTSSSFLGGLQGGWSSNPSGIRGEE